MNFTTAIFMIQRRLPWIATLFCIGIFAGCEKQETPAEAVARPVRTLVLTPGAEAPFRRFPGEIAAAETLEMSFEVPGRLVEFPAARGMVVESGMLLGRLDPANFQARLDGAASRMTTARQELARRRQLFERGVISQSELAEFRERFDVAEAAWREAGRALEDTRLVAPISGRVARTMAENFQNVRAKEPVLVLQDISLFEVDIQVPERDMSAMAPGITAESANAILEAGAEFPAIPDMVFPLRLGSFETMADAAARTFRVTFLLEPPSGRNILPGMTCTVLVRRVAGAASSQSTASATANGDSGEIFEVPVGAVATGEGRSWVWKIDPASMRVSRVPVEVLLITGGSMRITAEGLAGGDEIAANGVRLLSEGMTVSRIAAESP